MEETIKLWRVNKQTGGVLAAAAVDPLQNTETEASLEELLVASPELLMRDLRLIGRQVPTSGGPLDLLGVDEDGRLVVFELKRGTLTRDAVAQIIDYASDLHEMPGEELAKLIQDHSRRPDIESIDDFRDWHAREFPSGEDALGERPRMIIVGLGADERARRMVVYLADLGADIRLLTFHAFGDGEQMFLARQEELPASGAGTSGRKSDAPTKATNLRVLKDHAKELGVSSFLARAEKFLAERIPGYQWPGKTSYSYGLQERTSEGRPTSRQYATLYVNSSHRGELLLVLPVRSLEAAGKAVAGFEAALGKRASRSRSKSLDVRFDEKDWNRSESELDSFLRAMVEGRRKKLAAVDSEDNKD